MAAAQQILLQDDFEDDAIGQSPNGPTIGEAVYGYGGGGTYIVAGTPGQQRLVVGANGMPGTTIEYTPLDSSLAPTTIRYSYAIHGGGTSAGLNSWVQSLVFAGGDIALFWASEGDGRELVIAEYLAGTPTYFHLGTAYDLETTYAVHWQFGSTPGSYSLSIDDVMVAQSNSPIAASSFYRMYFSSNWGTSGSASIDNVSISAVPEPSAAALFGAGTWCVSAVTLRARRRRLRDGLAALKALA